MKVQGGLRRFAHAHYVCNVLALASYVPLRRLMADPAAVEGVNARLFGYVRASGALAAAAEHAADSRAACCVRRSARRPS